MLAACAKSMPKSFVVDLPWLVSTYESREPACFVWLQAADECDRRISEDVLNAAGWERRGLLHLLGFYDLLKRGSRAENVLKMAVDDLTRAIVLEPDRIASWALRDLARSLAGSTRTRFLRMDTPAASR
jgi:hypothetical protein